MSIRLVALDIDDTLVDHSSIIPQRSLDALRKAQAKGVSNAQQLFMQMWIHASIGS